MLVKAVGIEIDDIVWTLPFITEIPEDTLGDVCLQISYVVEDVLDEVDENADIDMLSILTDIRAAVHAACDIELGEPYITQTVVKISSDDIEE